MASNSSLATMKAIKREAPDDEPMIVENPMKRRAVESHDTPQINGAIPSHRPALVTEDQLRGKSSDELVQVVLQLQSSYSEQVADLKGQYATLSSQLNDLKATLAAFFTANLAALQSLSKVSYEVEMGSVAIAVTLTGRDPDFNQRSCSDPSRWPRADSSSKPTTSPYNLSLTSAIVSIVFSLKPRECITKGSDESSNAHPTRRTPHAGADFQTRP